MSQVMCLNYYLSVNFTFGRKYPRSGWKAEGVERKKEEKSRWKQWPASLPSATTCGAHKLPGPIMLLIYLNHSNYIFNVLTYIHLIPAPLCQIRSCPSYNYYYPPQKGPIPWSIAVVHTEWLAWSSLRYLYSALVSLSQDGSGGGQSVRAVRGIKTITIT